MDARLLKIEDAVLEGLVGRFNDVTDIDREEGAHRDGREADRQHP